MATINLRDYYPFYQQDEFIEVSDALAGEFLQWNRDESNFHRKKRRYHANFSLDFGDEIEKYAIHTAVAPSEHYEKKLLYQQLKAALLRLPDKQIERVYAYYILGLSKADIARLEKVDHAAVRRSITSGLKCLEIYLRKFK